MAVVSSLCCFCCCGWLLTLSSVVGDWIDFVICNDFELIGFLIAHALMRIELYTLLIWPRIFDLMISAETIFGASTTFTMKHTDTLCTPIGCNHFVRQTFIDCALTKISPHQLLLPIACTDHSLVARVSLFIQFMFFGWWEINGLLKNIGFFLLLFSYVLEIFHKILEQYIWMELMICICAGFSFLGRINTNEFE